MLLRKVIEILWLVIAIASLLVFIYVLVTEGFIAGKAWVYLITTLLGAAMFLLRRKQRMGMVEKEK